MKIWAMTMSYNQKDLIERSLSSFYGSCVSKIYNHILCDQRYPLPSAHENEAFLHDMCDLYGLEYFTVGKNLGYHEMQNEVIRRFPLSDEDILINYDPDSMIQDGSEDWLSAIELAFTRDPTLAVVGLNNTTIDRELNERGYFDEHIGDLLTLRFMKMPVIMSIVAWKVGFIREVGGLKESSSMYGGIETTMFPILCAHGKRWAVLKDYWEDISLNRQADPEYNAWKHRHGYLRNFEGDFESYLKYIGRIK